jgi:hypothetical protein
MGSATEKFLIEPHFRLHEWIALEKGYFDEEGLDYAFKEQITKKDAQGHNIGNKRGAYTTFEEGRRGDVSSACHWTVNVAASKGHGRIYADAYSVSPCGVFVHPDSGIKTPDDLAGIPISVGHQSGTHYSTIQALEKFLSAKEINLSFNEGMLWARMEKLIDGEVPATTLFSGPYYFLSQLGFKKIIECTFMMAGAISDDTNVKDVDKYYRALKRAQFDIDLRPELYVHHYNEEFPERFHEMMDLRYFGPGERIVFEPYSRGMYDASRNWILEKKIFPDGDIGHRSYEEACYVSA